MPIAMRYGGNNNPSQGATYINGGGGGGGGVTVTLVWTNPNPTSNFAAQTLSLDLSGYDAVAIVSRQAGNTDRVSWDFALIGETIVTQVKNMASATIYGRSAEATSSGIVFGNGYAGSTAGATNAIPVKIYGIKGIT